MYYQTSQVYSRRPNYTKKKRQNVNYDLNSDLRSCNQIKRANIITPIMSPLRYLNTTDVVYKHVFSCKRNFNTAYY